MVEGIENIEVKESVEVIVPFKGKSKNLNDARKNKMDEFYTQSSDIEKELKHYKEHFKNKVIFCNCDDPLESNFWKYFYSKFDHIGLKKIISTHYDYQNPTYKLEYDGKDLIKTDLLGNGDFRSPECIELLKESDIVVTNPPFSLFREYVAQLIEYNKSFIIIGSLSAITYKDIFKLFKDNKLWMGYGFSGGNAFFRTPQLREFAKGVYNEETGLVKFRNVSWYTNLDILKRYKDLNLFRNYNLIDYPKYDNYNAISVSKIKDIPVDYDGEMGVPITFLSSHNPDQFEIIGSDTELIKKMNGKGNRFFISGKILYARIVIKKRVR